MVAAGTGVSLGKPVAVGCRTARAVSNACVNAALISGVGTDAGAGWQALSRMDRRTRREVAERNVVIVFLQS